MSNNHDKSLEVAMELTQLYCKEYIVENDEELQEIFTRFYATTVFCQEKTAVELEVFIPNAIKKMMRKIK